MTGEARLFTGATAVAALHGLDDAFGHLGSGVGPGEHALPAAITVVIAAAGVAAFPRLRPGLRAALALAFGVLAAVNGALHLRHMGMHGLDLGHASGAAAFAAGLSLVALAAAIPWRHRGGGARNRAIAVAGGFLGCLFVLGPMALGVIDAHRFRVPVGAPPDLSYETVRFAAGDGVRLTGWYRAPRNGATILLAHGGGSDRRGSARHARMLARHGYGVLLYDARGTGESDGNQSSYGWGWTHDVAGAVDFLESRPETGRIGALGISSGADAVLEAAPDHPELAAIVTDGAAAGSFEDWHRVRGDEIGMVPGWVMFKTIEVLTGSSPGAALEDRVARIRAPLLMVSAPEEDEFASLYERAAGGRADRWHITDAGHTAGLREHPEKYERRVAGFFDRALGQAR